jgi:hypothetical protein
MQVKNILISGCSYVLNSDWGNIRFRNNTNMFDWHIYDNNKTAVSTNCPYDRFVGSKPLTPLIKSTNVIIFII